MKGYTKGRSSFICRGKVGLIGAEYAQHDGLSAARLQGLCHAVGKDGALVCCAYLLRWRSGTEPFLGAEKLKLC